MMTMFGFHCLVYCAVGYVSLTTVFCVEGKDNKGRNFIFGFMENEEKGVLEVFITTDHLGVVVVNITTPLFNPGYFQTLRVKNKEVEKVSFDHNIGGVGTEFSNKGIYVQSDNEVSIYAVNKASGTTDACIVFPVDTLGDEYYIITWNEKSQFMIIATEDNTEVIITVGRTGTIIFNNQAYNSGMSFTMNMNKFQTFHAFGGLTSDYSGTYITSSKVIAVFSGSKCNKIGHGSACDHLISQMTPVETFGKHFVTINMASCNRPVNFKIVVSENDTLVNISGRSIVSLLKPGDSYSFSTTSLTSTVVLTDKPAALAFFSEGGCGGNSGDPAMILLPPIQQFAADYTFSTVEFPSDPFTSSLTIVIAETAISGLLLDRKNITSEQWRPIIGSNTLRITNILITEGSHTIYHINPTVTFLAVSTGVGHYNSYGYSAGQRLAPINNNCSISVTVAGDIIDNDCDGLIDEELKDGKDNDGDGKIDEDLAKYFEEFESTTSELSTKELPTTEFSTIELSTKELPTTKLSTISMSATSTRHFSKTTFINIFASTTTSRETVTTTKLTTTSRQPTTTSIQSTTTLQTTSDMQMQNFSEEVLSTDLVIVSVVISMFALCFFITGMFVFKWKRNIASKAEGYDVSQ